MFTLSQRLQKRTFDIVLSVIGIFLTWWVILVAWLIASFETKGNGLFTQERIGKDGKKFTIYKIKTMNNKGTHNTTVTTSLDNCITKSGKVFRKTKIDELPQLFNVLFGSMSFVGPRPDVEGFADTLEGENRIILSVRPGVTGPASLKYKNEEEILAKQANPEKYNKEIIWPDKVLINKEYIASWSLKNDIICLIKTVSGA